jgi:hypothetical protein
MGADGPWEATERIDALQVTPLSEEAAARVRERFRALAGRLGVEAETDPDPTVPGGSGEGWPIEVAARVEGLDSDGPELSARLAAAARLIDRIERHLPEPWPVVFWEPWSDLPADRQAAWLLAVSEEIAPRPLLAVVRAQRA